MQQQHAFHQINDTNGGGGANNPFNDQLQADVSNTISEYAQALENESLHTPAPPDLHQINGGGGGGKELSPTSNVLSSLDVHQGMFHSCDFKIIYTI